MHEIDRVVHDDSDALYASREWAQEVARIGSTDERHFLKFCRERVTHARDFSGIIRTSSAG